MFKSKSKIFQFHLFIHSFIYWSSYFMNILYEELVNVHISIHKIKWWKKYKCENKIKWYTSSFYFFSLSFSVNWFIIGKGYIFFKWYTNGLSLFLLFSIFLLLQNCIIFKVHFLGQNILLKNISFFSDFKLCF